MSGSRWGSVRASSVARLASGTKRGGPLKDLLREEVRLRESGAELPPRGVGLPVGIDAFNGRETMHTVWAWHLNRRGNLTSRERRFVVASIASLGFVFPAKLECERAKAVIRMLNLYEIWWRTGSNMLQRDERLKSLDAQRMTERSLLQLGAWVDIRLAIVAAMETSRYNVDTRDFNWK